MKSKIQDPEARPFLVSSDRFKHFRNVSDVSIDSNVIAASMGENWAFLEPPEPLVTSANSRSPFTIASITENGYHQMSEPSVCVSSLSTPLVTAKNVVSRNGSQRAPHTSANGITPYSLGLDGQLFGSQPNSLSSCSTTTEQLSSSSSKLAMPVAPLTVATTQSVATLDPFCNGEDDQLGHQQHQPQAVMKGKPRAFTLPSPPVSQPTKNRPKGQISQNSLQSNLEGLPPPPPPANNQQKQLKKFAATAPSPVPLAASLFDDEFATAVADNNFSLPLRSSMKVDAQTSPMSIPTPALADQSQRTASAAPLPSILSTPAGKSSSLDNRNSSSEIVRTQQRVRIQSGAKDDQMLQTPTSRNPDGLAMAGGHVKGHRRSHSAPVQVQIIMAGTPGGTAPQPFKPDSPRFVCCSMHIATMSRIVAYIELVFCIIAFIAIIAGGATAFSLPASGMIIGGVATMLLCAIVAGFILLGLKRHSPSWLIPYLVVKGFQLGAVGIALFISILGLLGFTTLFGIVSANPNDNVYHPPPDDPYGPELIDPSSTDSGAIDYGAQGGDESNDPAQKAVNNLTVVFASVFVCLLIVLGFMILFFVIVFKCYRYLRELLHYSQTVSESVTAMNLTPAVTYQVIPRESDGGTDIVIQGHGCHGAAALTDSNFATTMINHSYSDPNCSTNHNSRENLVVSPHSTGASTFFVGSSMIGGNAIGGGSTPGMTITELDDSDKATNGPVYKRLKD